MQHSSTPAVPISLSGDTLALLSQRTCFTDAMLRQRYSPSGSAAEVNLVLCHYLYGLVATAVPQTSPAFLLEMLRYLGSLVLPTEAVSAALFTVPPDPETRLGRMVGLAEQAGRREGEDIRSAADTDTNDPIEPGTTRRDTLSPADQSAGARE